MEFTFEPKQPYQQEAIASVVDLFEGQPADADVLITQLVAESWRGWKQPHHRR